MYISQISWLSQENDLISQSETEVSLNYLLSYIVYETKNIFYTHRQNFANLSMANMLSKAVSCPYFAVLDNMNMASIRAFKKGNRHLM
jgi:hypothetical protein